MATIDERIDERTGELAEQLKGLLPGFPNLFFMIEQFIRENPVTGHRHATTVGERILLWLERTQDLSLEQQDYIACQRVRHSLEAMTRRRFHDHVMFQERYRFVQRFLPELHRDRTTRIFLNPIRAWTRLQTGALLDVTARQPADVLIYAARGESAMAFFDLEGKALLNELADFQPCPLADWTACSNCGTHEDLLDFLRGLAARGVVAFG